MKPRGFINFSEWEIFMMFLFMLVGIITIATGLIYWVFWLINHVRFV